MPEDSPPSVPDIGPPRHIAIRPTGGCLTTLPCAHAPTTSNQHGGGPVGARPSLPPPPGTPHRVWRFSGRPSRIITARIRQPAANSKCLYALVAFSPDPCD